MLSKPGISELGDKIGNRYEVSLAVAKRARQIADERMETGDEDITDPVEVASQEINDGKVSISKESLDIKEELIDDIVDAESISSKIRSKKKADELSILAEELVEHLKKDDDYDDDILMEDEDSYNDEDEEIDEEEPEEEE